MTKYFPDWRIHSAAGYIRSLDCSDIVNSLICISILLQATPAPLEAQVSLVQLASPALQATLVLPEALAPQEAPASQVQQVL